MKIKSRWIVMLSVGWIAIGSLIGLYLYQVLEHGPDTPEQQTLGQDDTGGTVFPTGGTGRDCYQ